MRTAGRPRPTDTTLAVLLILGVVTSLASSTLAGPVLLAPSNVEVAHDEGRLLLAALLQLATALGAAAIGVGMASVVMKHSVAQALGSATFRSIEAAFSGIAALSMLGIVAIAAGASPPSSPSAEAMMSMLDAVLNASNFVIGVLFYGIGAACYYLAFYRSSLVPRWLSVWGLAGVVLVMAAATAVLFRGPPFKLTGSLQLFAVPIAAQELALAGWLLVRGFDRDASDRDPINERVRAFGPPSPAERGRQE
jgi:hypothetical protein